jgi:hypothetical protein
MMALGGYNTLGPAGTLDAMREAARPQPAEDDLPSRVAWHDDVLAKYSAQLADHGDRLDRLETGHGTDDTTAHDGG